MSTRSNVDVLVIGAGAAGIGAGLTLSRRRVDFAIVEASHRIGGRGYTEELAPGEFFDLGCHWLHSASINPLTAVADRLGYTYRKEAFSRRVFTDGAWQPDTIIDERDAYADRTYAAMHAHSDAGEDISIYDCMDRDNRWASMFDHWITLDTSADPDQVSAFDLVRYNDTNEDWPIREGYGRLICELGAALPVELNCAVERIDWRGSRVVVTTAKGVIKAKAVILTVSTGVLGADDIEFLPRLPDWKRDAISAVPLGHHNRICIRFERNLFGEKANEGVTLLKDNDECMALRIRPFGFQRVVGGTGGRFAQWLERAGVEASVAYVVDCIAEVFGNGIRKHVGGHVVSAWSSDPWVRGAYAASLPGQFHQRQHLAATVAEKILFAGEATSDGFQATVHGAYLSGEAKALEAVRTLKLDS